MGFLRLRAGDAQREAEKKKPRHAFNDEVWSSVKPYAAPDRVEEYISFFILVKHRNKLDAAQTAMEETQTQKDAEKANAKETKTQIDELFSWAERFGKEDVGTKHLIVGRLIERVDVSIGYKEHIKFKILLNQFIGQE